MAFFKHNLEKRKEKKPKHDNPKLKFLVILDIPCYGNTRIYIYFLSTSAIHPKVSVFCLTYHTPIWELPSFSFSIHLEISCSSYRNYTSEKNKTFLPTPHFPKTLLSTKKECFQKDEQIHPEYRASLHVKLLKLN